MCYEYENMEISSLKIRLRAIHNAVYGFMLFYYEVKRIILYAIKFIRLLPFQKLHNEFIYDLPFPAIES